MSGPIEVEVGEAPLIHPTAVVERGAEIGDRTRIWHFAHVMAGARIGADCVVHSNVAIRERVTIGDRVVLQNGVVVGGDGYGFVRRGDGTLYLARRQAGSENCAALRHSRQ